MIDQLQNGSSAAAAAAAFASPAYNKTHDSVARTSWSLLHKKMIGDHSNYPFVPSASSDIYSCNNDVISRQPL